MVWDDRTIELLYFRSEIMRKTLQIPTLMLFISLLAAACAPSVNLSAPTPAKATASPMEEPTPTNEIIQDEEMSTETSPAATEEMMDQAVDWPSWMMTDRLNVNSGETFQVADYKGKVVLVETLAMWCSNCMKQQQQVKILHEKLAGEPDFISIGLDIDINENLDDLAQYTRKNEFDWVYTVASKEMAQEIGILYSAQFLNPASTPILLIDRNGEVHLLPFGIKSAADLEAAILPLLHPAS
jgi:thiol-disulfide isomerase/thioredoxin